MFCLHFDLIDQVERTFLLRVGRGGDLESGCVVASVGRATGVAHDGGELSRQIYAHLRRR